MPSDLKISLNDFKPNGQGIGRVLGALQTAVMEVLWREPNLAVNDVESRLRHTREIAHTTVLTILDRMFRKGYLTREKEGKAYIYAARYTREEFEQMVAQQVLGALLGQFSEPALSAFVDLVGEDAETLDRLENIIRQKREQKSKEDKT